MRKAVYKKLMLSGKLPWRNDVLKRPPYKESDEKILLREGWAYVTGWLIPPSGFLFWRGNMWRIMYKVVSEEAVDLPVFNSVKGIKVFLKSGQTTYHHVHFMAVSVEDKHAELFARGNFLKILNEDYPHKFSQIQFYQ